MRTFYAFILINFFLIGCADAGNTIAPSVQKTEFPGFELSETGKLTSDKIAKYEYQQTNGKVLAIDSCSQAENLDLSLIPEFEYFRFRLLLVSCKAVQQIHNMKASQTSHFSKNLDKAFYEKLPAEVIPQVGEKGFKSAAGKMIANYRKDATISLENDHTGKIITEDDEIYLTLLARGDLTGDGIEDLLIKSEWFARKAFGKHVDLLVLSRTRQDGPVSISWRLDQ